MPVGMFPKSDWGLHSHSIAIAIGLGVGPGAVAVAGLGRTSPFVGLAGQMHTIVAVVGVVVAEGVAAGAVGAWKEGATRRAEVYDVEKKPTTKGKDVLYTQKRNRITTEFWHRFFFFSPPNMTRDSRKKLSTPIWTVEGLFVACAPPQSRCTKRPHGTHIHTEKKRVKRPHTYT